MARAKIAGNVKTADVASGLFIVRYVSADDAFEPPIVTFTLDPSQEQDAEFFLHPDAHEPILWQPGSSLIMRTVRPVRMQVEVTPRRQAGSIAANVKVERLTQGEPINEPEIAKTFGFPGLRLMGHVAGRGDVFVNLNEWIAGPSAPSRVEGISLEWPNKPPHFDIRYSVKVGQSGATSSQMMNMGSFAGSRGRAIPLTGVAFELSGEASSDYRLCVEAGFLASPIMREIGKRVVLSGPTGREPLVGLRMNLELANRDLAREGRRGSPAPSQPLPGTSPPVRRATSACERFSVQQPSQGRWPAQRGAHGRTVEEPGDPPMAISRARRAARPLSSHNLRPRLRANPRRPPVATVLARLAPDSLPRHSLRHRLCTNALNHRHLPAACGSSVVVSRRASRPARSHRSNRGWKWKSPIATAPARPAAGPLPRHSLRPRLCINPLNHRRLLAVRGSSTVVPRKARRPAGNHWSNRGGTQRLQIATSPARQRGIRFPVTAFAADRAPIHRSVGVC